MARPALLPAAVPGGAGDVKYRLDDGQIEVVDDRVAEALRAKTPAERMRLVADSWAFARNWVRAGVASQHPDWDGSALDKEVSRRLLRGPA